MGSGSNLLVADAGVETVDEVRAAGRPLAAFSPPMAEEEAGLKRLLYARLYGSPHLDQTRAEAERIVTNLAAAYRADPSLLPDEWRIEGNSIEALRTIGDFIAGMTDRFAIARH